MNLLAIETSTEFLSLAASRGGEVLTRHFAAGQRHAELVLDAVSELLERAALRLDEIQGIAYGEGPGSFTGLRIACGVVQGLALARGIKVLGVSTLLAVAEEAAEEAGVENALVCVDARMGEVYHAAYRRNGGAWQAEHAPALCGPQEVPVPQGRAWTGCGTGFAAFGELLRRRMGGVLEGLRPEISPTAAAVLRLARPRFERGDGGAPESAIPVYLRDKVALKTSER